MPYLKKNHNKLGVQKWFPVVLNMGMSSRCSLQNSLGEAGKLAEVATVNTYEFLVYYGKGLSQALCVDGGTSHADVAI